jgi:predicted small lipoprotein YifL
MKKIVVFLTLLALVSCSKHGPVDPDISDNNRYNLDHAVESLKEMYSDTLEGKLKGEYGG